jgi:hypothetical protein
MLAAVGVGFAAACSDLGPFAHLPIVEVGMGDSVVATIVNDTGPRLALRLVKGDTVDIGLFPSPNMYASFATVGDSTLLRRAFRSAGGTSSYAPDRILGFVVESTGTYHLRIAAEYWGMCYGKGCKASGPVTVKVRRSVPTVDIHSGGSNWRVAVEPGETVADSVMVRNLGAGTAVFRMTSEVPWLRVEPSTLVLPGPGRADEFGVIRYHYTGIGTDYGSTSGTVRTTIEGWSPSEWKGETLPETHSIILGEASSRSPLKSLATTFVRTQGKLFFADETDSVRSFIDWASGTSQPVRKGWFGTLAPTLRAGNTGNLLATTEVSGAPRTLSIVSLTGSTQEAVASGLPFGGTFTVRGDTLYVIARNLLARVITGSAAIDTLRVMPTASGANGIEFNPADGNLYFVHAATLYRWNATAGREEVIASVPGSGIAGAARLAVDSRGYLYVALTRTVLVLDRNGTIIDRRWPAVETVGTIMVDGDSLRGSGRDPDGRPRTWAMAIKTY